MPNFALYIFPYNTKALCQKHLIYLVYIHNVFISMEFIIENHKHVSFQEVISINEISSIYILNVYNKTITHNDFRSL